MIVGSDKPSPLTTEAVAAACRGDSDGIVAVYRALSDPIYAYLLRNTRNEAWAADLTADVFLDVIESAHKFKGTPDNFRGWVFRIARNTMLDHFRKQSRRRHDQLEQAADSGHLPAAAADTESEALEHVERARILEVVEGLSPDQRDVVMLRLVADLPIAEVAEILGKKEGAVKALQHRAMATMARRLKGAGQDLPGTAPGP
ncbi:MAG TPA: RNA polymerase sigma factor [Actinomycetota bacterium]|nr:RNA polymerase sigma factor [Actinomycetota bacterium]